MRYIYMVEPEYLLTLGVEARASQGACSFWFLRQIFPESHTNRRAERRGFHPPLSTHLLLPSPEHPRQESAAAFLVFPLFRLLCFRLLGLVDGFVLTLCGC